MWRRIHKDLVKDGCGGKRIQLGMRQWMLLDVGLPWWRYNVLTMDYQVCILIVLIFIHHHLFSLKTGWFHDLSVLFRCLCGALLLLVITIIIIIISDQFLSWLPHILFLVIQSGTFLSLKRLFDRSPGHSMMAQRYLASGVCSVSLWSAGGDRGFWGQWG